MDDELIAVLAFGTLYGCVVLLFLGALKARKGKSTWALRTLMTGATFVFFGATVLIFYALIALMGAPGFFREFMIGGIISYLAVLIGLLVYTIGFLGFCARWGATGRRRAELLEITTALSAAKEQAQREAAHRPNTTT